MFYAPPVQAWARVGSASEESSSRSTTSSSHVSDFSLHCIFASSVADKSPITILVWNCLQAQDRKSLLAASQETCEGLCQDILAAAVLRGIRSPAVGCGQAYADPSLCPNCFSLRPDTMLPDLCVATLPSSGHAVFASSSSRAEKRGSAK